MARQAPEPSEDQRQVLERWLRRRKTSQALALRARIVLETAAGKSDSRRHDARDGRQVAAAVSAR